MENKNSTTGKTIKLKSSDGAEFSVPEAAAMQSTLIRRMIKDNPTQELIPLTEVNSQILTKVVDYCKHQAEVTPTSSEKAQDEEMSDWDREFLDVSEDMICDLLVAAHYLGIKGLLHIIAKKSEDAIEKKSFQELCQTLNFDFDDRFCDAIVEVADDKSDSQ